MAALLYIFILLSQFGIDAIFGRRIMVGGYPVLTWFIYAIYVIAIVYSLFYITRTKSVYRNRIFFFIYLCIFTAMFIYSMMRGTDVMKILSTSVYYVLPIVLFPTLVCIAPQRESVIKFICLTSMLGGLLSVMFMLGLLSGIASENTVEMTRSSTIVDAGLGLVAVALALYMIFYESKNYSFFCKYGTLLAGLLIVAGGQSRARIIVMVLVIAASVIINIIFSSKNRMAVIRVGIFVAIAAVAAFYLIPQARVILTEIVGRFDTFGTDSSSVYRVFERDTQMNAFYSNPVAGVGWNGLSNVRVTDLWGNRNQINNHNMYSSILAYGGILYALPFFMWFIMLIFGEMKKVGRSDTAKLHIVLLMIIAVLSWSSAGFVKYSQMLSVIIIYLDIIDREHIPCPIKRRKAQKFAIKFR